MRLLSRFTRIGLLLAFAAAFSGCVVLPYGSRHHRHGHYADSNSYPSNGTDDQHNRRGDRGYRGR